MNAINWLLIHAGNAALAAWHALASVAAAVWEPVDRVLNFVLSPLLAVLNPLCTAVGDGIYWLLSPLPTWLGLVLLSVLTGVVMLVIYRYTSNQAAIGQARDDITANLLAVKLFKDDIGVGFRAQGRLLGALARLQWHMLRPLVIMLLPVLLVLAQMGVRYQWRPLRPGEDTLIRVHLRPGELTVPAVILEPNAGLTVEAGPVPGGGQLVWRVRAAEPGRHTLRFRAGDTTLEKELVVGDGLQRVSAERTGPRWTAQLFHPTERLLPADSPVRSIEILYGGVDSRVYGAGWWILTFFAISMLAALVLVPVFKVRI